METLPSAQHQAEELFAEVVSSGLIRPGVLESELSNEIHALLTYYARPPDRRLAADDVVYLDFGPVFNAWEADFGRSYVLGQDPRKHRLVAHITAAFRRGKQLYLDTPDLTAGSLYDDVRALAFEAGWQFGAPTAGHLIGHVPHEHAPGEPRRFSNTARGFGGFCEELLTLGAG